MTETRLGRGWSFPRGLVLGLGLHVLFACGRSTPPRWIALMDHPLPKTLAEEGASHHPWRDGRTVELATSRGVTTLTLPILREDWTWAAENRVWHLRMPLHLPVQRGLGNLQLIASQEEIPRRALAKLVLEQGRGFALKNGELVLKVSDETPPVEVSLRYTLASAQDKTPGRFRESTFAGDGIVLMAGASASFRVDIPPASVLRLGTAEEPILDNSGSSSRGLFRVRLNGEVLLEHGSTTESATCAWHSVPLPMAGLAHARFDLEAEGPLARRLFLDPRIGPRNIGAPGKRPWADPRPDLIVLLADTFRADNLTAYGSRTGLTPNLDTLAERSLCFRRTWSTSSWTLPAHASLFTGFFPLQVLTSGAARQMPGEVESVVERLASAGYRTGAVTDGGFVSSQFGLDQGFSFFRESRTSIGDVAPLLDAARAFLEADDGRPTFLFFQTYRTHWPYRVSERVRKQWGEHLGLEGEATQILEELERLTKTHGGTESRAASDLEALPDAPRIRKLAGQLQAHYLGGVADLDHDLGGFLELLEQRKWLDSGYLVFTSDHGEAFHEHGVLFHSGVPYEEQMRIPLLIAGRGITGARSEHPASLVDLAPTLAELAGLSDTPAWPGRSLLSPAWERTILGFECSRKDQDSFFVLEDSRKVLVAREGDAPGEPIGAFDLASDAGEARDQSVSAAWPRELLRKNAASAEFALAQLFEGELEEGEAVEMDATKADELRALGY